MVNETLAQNGLAPAAVDLLAVGLGPGSFTGLRVGLAFAKGLALALDRPALGLSSLAVLAGGAGPGLVAPVIDAKHKEIFTALYRVGPGQLEPLTEPVALGPDRLWPFLEGFRASGEAVEVVGPGLRLLKGPPTWVALGRDDPPLALRLAEMAFAAYGRGELAQRPLVPLYGRSPEIFKTWRPPARLGEAG
jgi:tRNA threonylcarbamoyladenosine biosynthesis protein TsaB